MRSTSWCRGLAALAALVFAEGCTTGDENASEDGGTPSGTGSTSGTGGETNVCPTLEVPRTPLRRLTRFEYENSAEDLLRVDASAAGELPPDEVTNGFDNNAAVLTVSPLHAEKYVLVSEALARSAVQNLSALTTCDPAAAGAEPCALEFARSFGRRAFRRQLTAEDEQMLLTAYAAGSTGGTHAEGIEVMIRAALQSPSFLYRLELASPTTPGPLVPLDQFELATRLSYLVWASGPDDALLDAAAAGQLGTREQLAAKAREMMSSPRALAAITNFVSQWTGARRLDITTKDPALFPEFTTEARAALAAELPAFVEYVLSGGDPSLSTLLTAPVAFVNSDSAPLYGVSAPSSALTLVELPESQGRAGLLTQAGFLSVQAHPDQTSPVLRGKFVRAMLLCEPPQPPPPNADITVPEINPNATARERFSAHQEAEDGCNICHRYMDPIGFAFESFDAVGRHRTMEGPHVIDVTGEIVDAREHRLAGEFQGVAELAKKLSGSEQVHLCVARQLFRFASGRMEAESDACSVSNLHSAFTSAGGNLQELFVAMTQTDAFLYRRP